MSEEGRRDEGVVLGISTGHSDGAARTPRMRLSSSGRFLSGEPSDTAMMR